MGASDALFGVIYTPEEVGADVTEDGLPVAETAVEVSGRDWPAEIDETTDPDLLRAMWGECGAWGELTEDLRAHFTARAAKLAEAVPVVEDAPATPSEDQPPLSEDDPWQTAATG